MTPELREALRLVVEAHPVGSSVTLLREHALELLDSEAETVRPPSLEEDLTCKAAGAILGRHDSTVRAMCERGEFSGAYRHNGREWRIPPAAVRAYKTAQRTGEPTGAPRARPSGRKADLSAWRKARAVEPVLTGRAS
jgi:excisionase family DNA binding protein